MSLKQQVTCLFLPTGYFHQLIKSFSKTLNAVEIIVIGGEQANAALIKNFLHYRKMNQLPLIRANNPKASGGANEAYSPILKNSMRIFSALVQ